MNARPVALALLVWAPLLLAAPMPPAARAEVGKLLDRLAASDCMFSRNGSWHSGGEARTHLQRKLEYLEKHGSPATAEDFIAHAGTKSSSSGKAYEVKCGSSATEPSAAWLTRELRRVRAK